MEDNREVYFASDTTRNCADEILKRCDDYWKFCASKGWFSLWRRAYFAYNPNRYTVGQTIASGESNEYRTIKVNHFKNLLEHIQTLTITDRPAWQPQSTNTDSTSQKQTIIAEGLLDYMMREKRVERHLKDATRNALLFTEGFVMERWDPNTGEAIATDPDTNETRYDGDIFYTSMEPVDVVRDPNLKAFNQRTWLVVRTYENKFDLATRYPEYYDEITSTKSNINAANHYLAGYSVNNSNETDLIPILRFFHAKTAACPDGRQMELLTDGTVLSDTILLYKHLPVQRISPSDQIGTPFGASVSTDLLPLQEMLDAHYTTILSINENYSIPKVLVPIGSQITTDDLQSGFHVITYAGQNGVPSILSMPTAPAGLFDAMEKLQRDMETISGVNSVSRGNPEASLRSGSALALVQSMAIQFHSSLQFAYIGLLEDIGTASIEILKDYAATPRIIQIAGKRNKGIIQQSFTRDDISSISRVHVQVGNPLSKTVSGRLSIAQDLLQNKIITNAAEYLQVLQTGQLEPLTQGSTAVLLNLSTENELLSEGTDVPVLFTDDHILHIQEHSALASDPLVRQNPELFTVISNHLQLHINMLSDPLYTNYRQLTGQPTLNTAPAQTANPQSNPALKPTMGQVTPGPMGTSQIEQKAQDVRMPSAPVNPMTHQRVELPGQ